MSTSRSRIARLLTAGLALVMAACSTAAPPPASATVADVASVSIRANAPFRAGGGAAGIFDPIVPTLGAHNYVVLGVYDKLLALDASGKLTGNLAKSWTTTPTSMVFTLKTGVTCSDGTPLTPTVVVNSIKYFLEKSTQVVRAFAQKTVTVSGDNAANTVTINLQTPFNDAAYGLAQTYLSVICPAGLAPGADFNTKAYGSGMYTLESITADAAVMKVRKEFNWGPYPVTGTTAGIAREIQVKVIASDTTAANLLITGGIDFASIAGADNARLKNEKSLVLQTGAVYNPYYMMSNETPGRVTADPAVRKAVWQAIDQQGWNQSAFGGVGVTSTRIFTPQGLCYADGSALNPPPGVAAARTTLQAAGYTGGATGPLSKNGKPVAIEFLATTSYDRAGGEYVVAQLNQAGFTATLKYVDSPAFSVAFNTSNFDLLAGLFGSALPNPSTNIIYFTGPVPPAGTNVGAINDPAMAEAIQKALTVPEAEKCAAWKVVQDRAFAGFHMMPVAAPASQWYAAPGWSYVAANYLEVKSLVRKK